MTLLKKHVACEPLKQGFSKVAPRPAGSALRGGLVRRAHSCPPPTEQSNLDTLHHVTSLPEGSELAHVWDLRPSKLHFISWWNPTAPWCCAPGRWAWVLILLIGKHRTALTKQRHLFSVHGVLRVENFPGFFQKSQRYLTRALDENVLHPKLCDWVSDSLCPIIKNQQNWFL